MKIDFLLHCAAVLVFFLLQTGSANAEISKELRDLFMAERGEFTDYIVVQPIELNILYSGKTELGKNGNFPLQQVFDAYLDMTSIDARQGVKRLNFHETIARQQPSTVAILVHEHSIMQNTRSYKSITTLAVASGLTELGSRIEFNNPDFEDRIKRQNAKIEEYPEYRLRERFDFFSQNLFSTACTSAYFSKISPPNEYLGMDQRIHKGAAFFVEASEHAEECISRLFLDFLGLRGLAISPEGLAPHNLEILKEAMQIETGTIISIDQ